jgi:putative DNA primase/helicase
MTVLNVINRDLAAARVLDPADPLATARRFVHELHSDAPLHCHRGGFWQWTGTHYAERCDATMRTSLYGYLEAAQQVSDTKGAERFKPTARRVSDVLDALRAATHLDSSISPPAWLDDRDTPTAGLVAMRNGLLDTRKGKLHPHDPAYFTTWSLPFDHDRDASEPDEWLTFLDSIWPDDPESINTLQETIGYIVSGDTRQQKTFLIVGPKRSGKGTIGRVLKSLIGSANTCGPTLSSLAGDFGLQPLLGKPLAIIADARLSGRTDQAIITERLLAISGEDHLDVQRKFKEAITLTLPTRVLILTNELPRLADTSGALASRFVPLVMTRSFYGREDHALSDRLERELPGILNWSLDGYRRLRERGAFVTPEASIQAQTQMEEIGSPVATFLKQRCSVNGGHRIACKRLYDEWRQWCKEHGRLETSEQIFGRDLRAVVPSIAVSQPREGGGRVRYYEGIGLASWHE